MIDFKKIEEEAKEVWAKHKAEIKAAVQNDPNKKLFSFLEGPPTANAPPAIHHLEVRTFKDIICKFKFMQGFSVPRKGGWDCHGLPVEVQVEKKLKLESKKDVVKYGIEKFNEHCREDVFCNIEDWNKSTKELDYWVDLENPYRTLDDDNVESVWWSLKELYKKKLLYEGHKVVPFCPRCGTPLSSHEVAQGYKNVTEDSVYIAFKAKEEGTYILAWTTTPWTLPGNVGLAVGPKIDYVKVELPDGDKLILGKEKLSLVKGDYKILKELKGKDLLGMKYEPLFDIKELQNENSHKIISADFVTTEDGTGIVHTAGMYGEDDYELCKQNDIPLVHTVNQDGTFNDLVKKWKGKFVKDVEKEIIEDLKKRHLLFKTEKFTHTYPFCWRCNSPLLYYAIDSWFIRVSTARDKLLKLNKEINWYPSHIKDGRFGKWLEGAKDWALSRSKFWGTPLPIWRCSCGNEEAIGSIKELKSRSTKKLDKVKVHKPYVDEIKLKCKCGKEMTRVPDVIDCWYDSGAASFAQFHYPFENKEEFEKRFPYEFISEGIDQTRGWFYTLHVLGALLFDKPAYKNVICAGHILDEKGEKMSKTKGNIIKPKEIIDKTGIDAVRLQFCINDTGNQKRFSYGLMKDPVLSLLTVLSNCHRYYKESSDTKLKTKKAEDKWILSKLNSMISEVTKNLENYDISSAFSNINQFVVKDFSRGYIKLTRDRNDTRKILGTIIESLSKLLAPFAPYISEYINKDFSPKASVHLTSWPKTDKKLIDENLEAEFGSMLEVIETGLSTRDKAQIGLKWPLAKAKITTKVKLSRELQEIVLTQINVKAIDQKLGEEVSVELDTKLTPELEAEGFARNLARSVQAARKKAELVKTDSIELEIESDFSDMLEKQKEFIQDRVGAKSISFDKSAKKFSYSEEGKIKGKQFILRFNKL